ncbi:YcjX family protein [Thalassotalea atypica]|uniref:YcjX family protein n=1 Tax=Thalassotalea atypica TaxID=2054316 RepID=UPI0025726343|nr:YcjX family protein [Thalassotalea atypica]
MALFSKEKINKIKYKAGDLLNRSLDQHVTLAVTGLSRSGKTAFITSLVNQLVNESNESQMSFFNPVHQGRFIAAKRVPQKNLHISRFDYEHCLSAFCHQPPHWPEPTKGISEIRLAIRYKPKDSYLKYATDMATLTLDITDYPGEWLLDLPMLKQTYEQWSSEMLALLQQAPRAEHAKSFIDKVAQINPLETADEDKLTELAKEYTELLHLFRNELGLSVIQPGRFILPGELEGAPILEFFPFTDIDNIDGNAYQNAEDTSFLGMLRARYLEYRERVVKRFYKKHFQHFDRQIVLADCLSPLNKGQESFKDLQHAISLILESYHYGQSNILSRLFSPKIDKLLFAATKSDHVTPEQHPALVSLLNQLTHASKHQLNFDAITMKTLAISSVKTTDSGQTFHQGKKIPVIKGRKADDDKTITLFPGAVPKKLPDQEYWKSTPFNFISFAPQQAISSHECLPHLRLDQVLQFLLGDKMK